MRDLLVAGQDCLSIRLNVHFDKVNEGSFQNLDQVEMIIGSVLNFNSAIKDRYYFKVRLCIRKESN